MLCKFLPVFYFYTGRTGVYQPEGTEGYPGIIYNMLKKKAGLTAVNLTFVLFYAIILIGRTGSTPTSP